jgi:hypothetical protein
MNEHQQAVHSERQSVYGGYRANMTGTSQQLSGLITQMLATGAARFEDGVLHLPAWATPLFMVAVKVNRAASGHYHADNLTDAAVYFEMALAMQREEQERRPDWGG